MQDTSLRHMTPVKYIFEGVITDSYYGWDTTEIKSLGFFEKWYDACKACDDWVYEDSCKNYRWPPRKWKIKRHELRLASKEK